MTNTRWQESTQGFSRVDREAGVIRGVKVLGLKSKNKRRYLKEAAAEAAPKYEGRKVYIDHVNLKETSERKTRERWGKLENVTADESGELYGDLHYLKSHPMTESILEAAERFQDFGLSHDAGGEVKKDKGETVVQSISEVYSVDVVQEPATNRNLFESHSTMKTKKVLQALRENLKVKHAAFLLARMTEMAGDGMGDIYGEDMSMDLPDEAAPGDEVAQAFRAAIMSIVDGDTDLDSKLEKIRMLLDVQQQVLEDDDPANDAVESEAAVAESKKIAELTAENVKLQEQVKQITVGDACRKLLEASNREVSDVRVKALSHLEEADRKLLIESWPSKAPRPATSPSKFQESLEPSGDDKLPESHEDIRKMLKV